MNNFIDHVKLVFQRDSQLRKALYQIMGFYPHDIELYRIAFAHKSREYRGRRGNEKPLNNERLEFLGDAILEAVTSDIVYHQFPGKNEGFLTNTRSKIVQRETLGRLAAKMGIVDLIHSNAHSSSHNSYIGGNAFEALVGAIYLDRGYAACQRFVVKAVIGKQLDIVATANTEVNFKSKLLEWSQKNKMRCNFRLDEERPTQGNNPTFAVSVVIEGVVAGSGKGFSKKQAEQNAAKDALSAMRRDESFKDSIFQAKEKRTAMEAEEYAALPKIDEIEREIAGTTSNSTASTSTIASDNARRNRRNRKKNSRPTQAPSVEAKTEAVVAKQQPAPAPKPTPAPKAEVSTEKKPVPAPKEVAPAPVVEEKKEVVVEKVATEEKTEAPKKRPARRKPAAKKPAPTAEATIETPAVAEKPKKTPKAETPATEEKAEAPKKKATPRRKPATKKAPKAEATDTTTKVETPVTPAETTEKAPAKKKAAPRRRTAKKATETAPAEA